MRKHDGVRTERYKLIHFYGKGEKEDAAQNKYQMIPGTRENRVFNWLSSGNYFQNDGPVDYYELYDLQADPTELNNIYGKPGTEKITRQLMKTLVNYRKTLSVDEY